MYCKTERGARTSDEGRRRRKRQGKLRLDGERDLVELRVIARVGEAESLLCAVGREDLVRVVEEILE